jgi:hypothetical protein
MKTIRQLCQQSVLFSYKTAPLQDKSRPDFSPAQRKLLSLTSESQLGWFER